MVLGQFNFSKVVFVWKSLKTAVLVDVTEIVKGYHQIDSAGHYLTRNLFIVLIIPFPILSASAKQLHFIFSYHETIRN